VWEAAPTATKAGESGGTLVNTYHIQEGANGVDIRLTSVHSKNSKTHAATLILETFRNSHFIQKLMLCLEGKEAAAKRPLESTKKDMMLICGGILDQGICFAWLSAVAAWETGVWDRSVGLYLRQQVGRFWRSRHRNGLSG
jgi:hypothetical protein